MNEENQDWVEIPPRRTCYYIGWADGYYVYDYASYFLDLAVIPVGGPFRCEAEADAWAERWIAGGAEASEIE